MTFLHAGLLAALAFTAIPVVLHLLLRQKPKRIDFPALRLVRQRSKKSTQRMRLRHLLLLVLRMLVIAAMVFAVSRPLLPAADWSFRWWDGLIVLGLIGIGLGVQRWWMRRVAEEPGLAMRESLTKRGEAGIWSTVALLTALLVLVPYGFRVTESMREAPSAEALDLPVTGVVVFDVSASMSYRQAGRSLLDVGRQIVAEHIGALPPGSRIAVTDNATTQPILFPVSLSSVTAQLERLTPSAVAGPLNQSIAEAYLAHRDDLETVRQDGDGRDRYVRRVYVVTDMAKTAWQFPDGSQLEEQLAVERAPNLFVLDVGVDTPQNRGFEKLILGSDDLPNGGALRIRTTYQSLGAVPAGESVLAADLYVTEDEQAIRVGSNEVSSNGQLLEFVPTFSTDARSLDGVVRLNGTDPLAIDDVRYFTVGVSPLPRVLLVASDLEDLDELRFALTGDDGISVPSVYQVEVARPNELTADQLAGRDVVCLVNVRRLRDSQWQALESFVREGGGLATFLGSDQIESFAYNRAAAQEVLPAKLDVWGSRPKGEPTRIVFPSRNGPFVDRLRLYDSSGLIELLGSARIQRFWRITPADDARVVARYTADALPGLVSRPVGKGLSMMLTTAIDLKPRKQQWNTLMLLDNGSYWVGIAFCDQLMRHLARVGSNRRNFIAGETVMVPLAEDQMESKLLLRTPDLRNLPLEPSAGNSVVIAEAEIPGHYAVTTSGGERVGAFSVNYPVEESNLRRADEGDLASIFGDEKFQLARGLDELNEEIDVARFGQEAFPMLVLLVVAVFAGETLLASRFYGNTGSGDAVRSTTRSVVAEPRSDSEPAKSTLSS